MAQLLIKVNAVPIERAPRIAKRADFGIRLLNDGNWFLPNEVTRTPFLGRSAG
jgi:hypothetical protein